MDLFWRSFIGRASLAKAFWIVYVLINILIILIVGCILYGFLIYNQTPASNSIFDFSIMSRMTLAADFPYLLASSIAVWHCSSDSGLIVRLFMRLIVAINIFLIFAIM